MDRFSRPTFRAAVSTGSQRLVHSRPQSISTTSSSQERSDYTSSNPDTPPSTPPSTPPELTSDTSYFPCSPPPTQISTSNDSSFSDEAHDNSCNNFNSSHDSGSPQNTDKPTPHAPNAGPPISTCISLTPETESFLVDSRPYNDHAICMESFNYIMSMPSKGVRELLISALQLWYQVPPTCLKVIKNVIGMLHTSSLILDDIEDGSTSRRSQPAAHVKYGLAKAINSANYVFAIANLEIMRLENPECMRIYSEELAQLHHGQGLDIHFRDAVQCPTESEYIHLVSQKTGGLFRMLCRLMQSASTTNDDLALTNLSNLLGQLFQIRDDYKNLKDPDYAKAKGFCEDLDEGKFSLMMIHGIQSSDEDGKELLLDALRKARERGEGEELPRELKIKVVEHLDKVGSFEYARVKMAELVMGIKKEYLMVLRQTGLRNVVVEGLVNKLANT